MKKILLSTAFVLVAVATNVLATRAAEAADTKNPDGSLVIRLLQPNDGQSSVQSLEDAEKICSNHLRPKYSGGTWTLEYEPAFRSTCAAVNALFSEEEVQSRSDQKDLRKLNDFLSGSAGK